MSCDNACYEAKINRCEDITIKAGLPASAAYFVIICKSNHSNSYQRQIMTDADGTLIIRKIDFPAGYFAYGYFSIMLRDTTDAYATQVFTFNSKTYECVLMQIIGIDTSAGDSSPINTIQ